MKKEAIIFLISRLRERANEYIARQLVQAGCTDLAPCHGSLLALLYQHGSMPMSVLAQHAGKRKSTVTELVARLELNGYVQRFSVPADNRLRHVALTQKALNFKSIFEEISISMQERLWRDCTPEEADVLCHTLQKLYDNLRDTGSEPHTS